MLNSQKYTNINISVESNKWWELTSFVPLHFVTLDMICFTVPNNPTKHFFNLNEGSIIIGLDKEPIFGFNKQISLKVNHSWH